MEAVDPRVGKRAAIVSAPQIAVVVQAVLEINVVCKAIRAIGILTKVLNRSHVARATANNFRVRMDWMRVADSVTSCLIAIQQRGSAREAGGLTFVRDNDRVGVAVTVDSKRRNAKGSNQKEATKGNRKHGSHETPAGLLSK